MTYSIVHSLFTGAVPNPGFASDTVTPHRLRDEIGAWHVEMNLDPTGAAAGSVQLQGRMEPSLSWVTIATRNLIDFTGAGAYPYALLTTDVQILPHMRAVFSAGASVAVGRVTTRLMD